MVVIMTYGLDSSHLLGRADGNCWTEECSWVLFPLQSRRPCGKGWEDDGRRELTEINPEKPRGGRRETDFKDEGRSGAFTHCQSELVMELSDSRPSQLFVRDEVGGQVKH